MSFAAISYLSFIIHCVFFSFFFADFLEFFNFFLSFGVILNLWTVFLEESRYTIIPGLLFKMEIYLLLMKGIIQKQITILSYSEYGEQKCFGIYRFSLLQGYINSFVVLPLNFSIHGFAL